MIVPSHGIGVIAKLRSSGVIFDSVSTILIEPIIEYFQLTFNLIQAFALESII